MGQAEQDAGCEQAAGHRAERALPGFVRAERGRHLVPSQSAAHVKGGSVSGPDHAQQEGQQRRAVAFRALAQGGQGYQRESDVKQAEDRGRSVGHELLDRPEKRAIDQQGQAQNAKDGRGLAGPLEVAGKERKNSRQHGNARRAGSGVFRQAQVLPCGQRGHRRNGQRKQPLPPWPQKYQDQNQRDQDECGEYAFHSGLRIHCRGGV